ncbi:hypothetical protein GRI97_03095 [Altererythrobacter xixiisoli]|uniref:Uncharacterized protein n=1 Tax=Croceibacterium xixiisoli TaxID=1476466 RepID=A0A6I4TPF9_9SPHN|nr:hypothetical protein [Croceibacterium xixiisoli]MXO97975.1 hypothetical protein [Croceibacterium xixiisoli]
MTDLQLESFLAARKDPPVPADLARRIVVSTAHLPQCDPMDVPVASAARAVPLAAPVRRRRWAGFSAGAAMAASLALAIFAQAPTGPAKADRLGSRPDGEQLAIVEPASAPTAEPLATPAPAIAAPAMTAPVMVARAQPAAADQQQAQPVQLAEAPTAAVAIGAVAAPQAPSNDAAPVQLARGWHRDDVREFALAGNAAPAEQVYGPVQDDDRLGMVYGPSGTASATVSLGIRGR